MSCGNASAANAMACFRANKTRQQHKICHMTVYCLYLAKIQEPNCPAASVQNDHNDLHFRLSLRLHFRDRSKSGRRGRAQWHLSFLISVLVHKVTIRIPQTRYSRKVPISEKRGQLSFGLPFIHSSIQQPCLLDLASHSRRPRCKAMGGA